MVGQPGDQPLHVIDRLGLRRAVLPRPALDLARDIVLAAAEVAKPERGRIESVQARKRGVRGVEDGGALGGGDVRDVRIPEHAAIDIGHEIERRADDACIVAIVQRPRDRKALRVQAPW